MKGFALVAGAIAALAMAGAAFAGGGGATTETFPVSFVLTDATCSTLPPGTTLTGTGVEKSISVTKTNKGVTRIHNVSHAKGTAIDQAGNTYVFNYSNEFAVENSVANPTVFSGFMNDSFSLAGKGPSGVHNGFQAIITTDFTTFFNFAPLNSRGDPLDFVTGTARCDPL